MSPIENDILDITVVVDRGTEYSAAIQQPNLAVQVDTGDVYAVSIQVPSTIPIDSSTTYIEVAAFAISASYANMAGSSSYAAWADLAAYAYLAASSSYADLAAFAITASYAENSAAASQEWDDILNKPPGIVTSSAQIDYTQLQNLPTTITASLQTEHVALVTGNQFITITGSLSTGIFAETRLIAPLFTMSRYSATQIDYVAQRSSEIRTGNLLANWSGSSIQYTDVSAVDVGAGVDLSFDFVIVGSNVQLRAISSGVGAGAWTVQTVCKMFPVLT